MKWFELAYQQFLLLFFIGNCLALRITFVACEIIAMEQ
jgi:hypothetical protein